MIFWVDIVFAISIGLCALLALIIFIEWNIYRALEYRKFKEHLRHIESLNKEKENKDE